tara:strand:+ start:1241 stop:2416 length:1176 start_codon:yes stop_codon:yes gene_type:complete
MTTLGPQLNIFLIAGEPSGDLLGAHLIDSLNRISPDTISYAGVGGPLMQSRGFKSLFDYRELAVMGFLEVLPHIYKLLQRINLVKEEIEKVNPDVIITIDSPSFCFRVLKRLSTHNKPRIHYVAPQIWAWRENRVYKYKKYIDHVLALFPFEPPYFNNVGLPCTFVSHPIIENTATADEGRGFRTRNSIGLDDLVVCALPGSRRSEVKKLMPVIVNTVNQLSFTNKKIHVIIPTVSTVTNEVRKLANFKADITIIENNKEKYSAFAASDIAIASSGTVTLELACALVPSVVVYKVSPLTALLARFLVKVKYVSIVNILVEREIFPEFLQSDCKASKIVVSLNKMIEDNVYRDKIIDAEKSLVKLIKIDNELPSDMASKIVLKIMQNYKYTT